MRARTVPALLMSVALVGAACSDDGQRTRPSDPTETSPGGGAITDAGGSGSADGAGSAGGGRSRPQALIRFDDCSTLLDHVRSEAAERVGPWGLDLYPTASLDSGDTADRDDAMADSPLAVEEQAGRAESDDAGDDTAGGGDFTGTNVQEVGIDEPDIVKTDGERILAIANNRLTYVDVSGAEPVVRGQLDLAGGWAGEMFFRGDRAFVLTSGGFWDEPFLREPAVEEAVDAEADFADGTIPGGPVEPGWFGPVAAITEIDMSDPANMSVVSTLRIQGEYLSARAIGDHVRLAVASHPSELPWVYPQRPSGEERARETNQKMVAEAPIEAWLPSYEIETANGRDRGQLLACDQVHRPSEFSGLETLSVIDLDLAGGLGASAAAPNATAVLAGGRTVYSSLDRFYVATTQWAAPEIVDTAQWSEEYETQVHAFAIAPGERTDYVASGSVRGTLLNQFSLDEHEGYLRILTTEGDPWSGNQDQSETGLVVLEEQGDQLVEVGRVGGLGRGEQLFSARLMGDIGFAVTFRQIDPFYVLDLSDPTNPRVTGELKIPGVSTYLHRVGEHHVLGVGQDATEDGRTTGLKLSLFDVSDVTNPQEVSVWSLPDSYSPAEYDHRAFQMSGSTAIVPVEHWTEGWMGAIVFDVGSAIAEVGRVDHVIARADPTSDCRPLDADDLTAEMSELWWMAQDASSHVQICGPDDVGGWGNSVCDRIPADEIEYWFYDEQTRAADIAALAIDPGDTIELCWRDDHGQNQIQRSLVIDDTLWTMSWSTLQANALDGLGRQAQLAIG